MSKRNRPIRPRWRLSDSEFFAIDEFTDAKNHGDSGRYVLKLRDKTKNSYILETCVCSYPASVSLFLMLLKLVRLLESELVDYEIGSYCADCGQYDVDCRCPPGELEPL